MKPPVLEDLPLDHDIDNLRVAMSFCPNQRTAVDAGAHRGIWTREMRTRFETVWSIEPVADNRCHIDGDKVLGVALGDRAGWATMAPGAENTGQWHIDPQNSGGPVEVVTLDSLMGLFGSVDFLKIDVEGNELAVLRGGAKLIERDKPVVCLEINGLHRRYGVADGYIEAWMTSHGYRLVAKINKDHIWAI